MEISASIEIDKPCSIVWTTITDFENRFNCISAIKNIKILNKPDESMVGFKWQETRIMFGKEAHETMWITHFVDQEYYQTRAENHGAVYISRMSVKDLGDKSLLTMKFSGEGQGVFVKIISALTGFLVKASMRKALCKDLEDIKHHIEAL